MTLSLHSTAVVANPWRSSGHVLEIVGYLESALPNVSRCPTASCRLHIVKAHYDRLFSRQRRKIFVIPNATDEAKNSWIYTSSDGLISSDIPNEKSINYDLNLSDLLPKSNFEQLGGIKRSLLDQLKAIHLHILASEQWHASRLSSCHRNYLISATNLIHYLAMRCLDLEQLNDDTASIGLLNLEDINAHVLASLTIGIKIVDCLYSYSSIVEENAVALAEDLSIHALKKKADFNREQLFGPFQDGSTTHIMVTVGQEAAESETLIPDLINRGTTIIRINCAHGDPNVWSEIVQKVKHSSIMLEKPCRVLMDLAGPKLRTERLKPGPCVVKISPQRNATGHVINPSQVWILQRGVSPPIAHSSPDAILYIDGTELLTRLEPGDSLRFHDARGKKRVLKVHGKLHLFGGVGFVTECQRAAYVQSGGVLYLKGRKGKHAVGQIVDVPASEQFIRVKIGDLLTISRTLDEYVLVTPSRNAHRITCSSSYLFDSVKPGDPISFDDGKIWGIIQGTSTSEIIVSITHASSKGTKLGSDKSINIPKSKIRFNGLTSKDLMDLEFVACHADMVGLSFVRDVQDIMLLQRELQHRKLEKLGIVLKIETRSGFENLPLLLLEAMKCPNPLGVMIARGDLAVECGWENLSTLQEEILTICSAAHVPVIWATQVFESLVKFGVPTRAEITDVASGRRASCIMLNKGKHVVEAVSTLNAILRNYSLKMKVEELTPLVLSNHLL